MRLDDLFKKTEEIDDMLGNQLLEISVKQHQVTISLEDSMLYFPYIEKILDSANNLNESFISTKGDILYFIIGDLSSEIDEESIFYLFMEVITEVAEKICTCPALEFKISTQYMKCFLDKPGLNIDDLSNYEKLLEANGKGELVLHPQRPYLLFVNGV